MAELMTDSEFNDVIKREIAKGVENNCPKSIEDLECIMHDKHKVVCSIKMKGMDEEQEAILKYVINELFFIRQKVKAERGDAEAQFTLGCIYGVGQYVAEDEKIALHWFRKAADQGNAKAIQHLRNNK